MGAFSFRYDNLIEFLLFGFCGFGRLGRFIVYGDTAGFIVIDVGVVLQFYLPVVGKHQLYLIADRNRGH